MDEIILSERKAREDIVKIINESGLPAFILKPIFKEILEQVNIMVEEQYNQAVLNKENEKGENNE